MDLHLNPPVGKTQALFDAWLNDQFKKLTDGLRFVYAEQYGVDLVNGTLLKATKLSRVLTCVASFSDTPNLNCIAVSAKPDATSPGSIRINVMGWSPAGGGSLIASTTAINVAWQAFGY